MHFTIVGRLTNVRAIATGRSVRLHRHLSEKFGVGRWRKMAGDAMIQLERKRNLDQRS
jgi:hypothetical protein